MKESSFLNRYIVNLNNNNNKTVVNQDIFQTICENVTTDIHVKAKQNHGKRLKFETGNPADFKSSNPSASPLVLLHLNKKALSEIK